MVGRLDSFSLDSEPCATTKEQDSLTFTLNRKYFKLCFYTNRLHRSLQRMRWLFTSQNAFTLLLTSLGMIMTVVIITVMMMTMMLIMANSEQLLWARSSTEHFRLNMSVIIWDKYNYSQRKTGYKTLSCAHGHTTRKRYSLRRDSICYWAFTHPVMVFHISNALQLLLELLCTKPFCLKNKWHSDSASSPKLNRWFPFT